MNMKGKDLLRVGILICLIGLIGCKNNVELEEEYLSCNKTSYGRMAEIDDGYFLVMDEFLFYADKEKLDQWVVVCNKPNCIHSDQNCNGYLQSSTNIWQYNGKLYEVALGRGFESPYIYEMIMDGSGRKKVCEIPIITTNESSQGTSGYGKATFQDQFLLSYGYLDENGLNKEGLLRLEDENGKLKIDTLYESVDEGKPMLLSGNEYWSIRGEDLIITTLYLEEDKQVWNNLCEIDEEKIKPINLPEDLSLTGGYWNGEVFSYYSPQEGFYEYNVSTGERKLIFENQLEDAQGYILSEDYRVECNRYANHMPEEAYLNVYMGKEWKRIELPDTVKKCDAPFYPLALASDRIFFRMNVRGNSSSMTSYLYYIMLEEEKPELIFAGKAFIGEEENVQEESSTMDESEEGIFANFQEVIVFDNEDYFCKITDVYLNSKNNCCIDVYFENKREDVVYNIMGNQCTVNGIQSDIAWGKTVSANATMTDTICFTHQIVDPSRLSEFYSASEYTDISIGFYISAKSNENSISLEKVDEKLIHIYPQGKENLITFTREPQDTDDIIVDKDEVSVTITGYEKIFVPGDSINVVIENKSDQYLKVKVEEASANGIAVKPTIGFGVYQIFVNPHSVALYPMTLFDGISPDGPFQSDPMDTFITTNGITSIEEIEMKLKISYYTLFEGEDEELVYETIVLNP